MSVILIVEPGPEAGRHPGIKYIACLYCWQGCQVFEKNSFLKNRQKHVGNSLAAFFERLETFLDSSEVKLVGDNFQPVFRFAREIDFGPGFFVGVPGSNAPG